MFFVLIFSPSPNSSHTHQMLFWPLSSIPTLPLVIFTRVLHGPLWRLLPTPASFKISHSTLMLFPVSWSIHLSHHHHETSHRSTIRKEEPFGITFQGHIHCGTEVLVARARGSWSHCILSQEAARNDERKTALFLLLIQPRTSTHVLVPPSHSYSGSPHLNEPNLESPSQTRLMVCLLSESRLCQIGNHYWVSQVHIIF